MASVATSGVLHGVRQLLTIVTGFTIAHSFTLIGSAFGLAPSGAWFPPFVEVRQANLQLEN